jgi:hypothetical protein
VQTPNTLARKSAEGPLPKDCKTGAEWEGFNWPGPLSVEKDEGCGPHPTRSGQGPAMRSQHSNGSWGSINGNELFDQLGGSWRLNNHPAPRSSLVGYSVCTFINA